MNLTAYEKLTKDKSFYTEINVEDMKIEGDIVTLQGQDSCDIVYVTDTMKDSLCKYVGLSSSINKGLYSTDKDLWYSVVTKLYKYYSKDSLLVLVSESDDSKCYIKGICNSKRDLLTNSNFIDNVVNYYASYNDIKVYDVGYTGDLLTSHVVITLDKDYTDYSNTKSFKVGVVFRNDELNSSYCRMALVYEDGVIYYLPSKYYNLSTSRYVKTTVDSREALEILMLKVYEDLTLNVLDDKISDVMKYISETVNKPISRMEYERVTALMSNVSSTSELSDEEYNFILEDLRQLDDFESLYGTINSDYLWKCTALGGSNLSDLLNVLHGIVKNHVFYPEDDNLIRELLGEYLTMPRVCQLLAKKLC